MTRDSIVAVYGFPAVEGQELEVPGQGDQGPFREAEDAPSARPGPVRLGTGRLEHELVVILDERLSRLVSSHRPPRLVRVGIAGRLDDEPFVEVVEILQVLSTPTREGWAVELVTPASAPTVWDVRSSDADQPVGPANGICFFYRASFC